MVIVVQQNSKQNLSHLIACLEITVIAILQNLFLSQPVRATFLWESF